MGQLLQSVKNNNDDVELSLNYNKSLSDMFLSFTLGEILNDHLYINEVKKIPESFLSLETYFRSFEFPLLEDLHAELGSCLNDQISARPYARVTRFERSSDNNPKMHTVGVDNWINTTFTVSGKKESYSMLPGDVFVFTDSKPESVSDLLRLRASCFLAILTKKTEEDHVLDDGGRIPTGFCVEISKNVEIRNPSFVVFLMNITEHERIWNALHMGANRKVVKQVLCSGSTIKQSCSLCLERNSSSWVEEFQTESNTLDDSQSASVLSSLQKLQCEHKSFVELTWGPPGTGKTKTISILLFTLLRTNRRTLVCGPTNVAVAELATRVQRLLKYSSFLSLNSIVCYGDKNLLKCNPEVVDIYLESLVKRENEMRLEKASLIFCTVSTAYRLHSVPMKPLDFLVIDEAAQVKECELLIPLQLPDIRHVVLFGDECQFNAVVHSNVSAKAGYGRSFFERMSSMGHLKHLLKMQYRMHPLISSFPNSKFYSNQVSDAPNVMSQIYHKKYLPSPLFGPYTFINISCITEDQNVLEIAVIMKILRRLYKEWNGSGGELSVGVISNDNSQVVTIQEKLSHTFRTSSGFVIKVSSVEGFQGSEVDIVILSTLGDNNGGSNGFVADHRRTNVALTRARHSLWILGNGNSLMKSQSIWKEVVSNAKDRCCLFNADEDKDIAKIEAEVKKELEQFNNILNADGMLYEDARWKVFFSADFKKSFAKLKSLHEKKLVMYLLLRLSCGWRPKMRDFYVNCDKSSQIVMKFKVHELNVICSVEIVKESVYRQVLKVWEILPLVNLLYFIERLDSTFQTYTENYINLCKAKSCIEGNLEVPVTWSSTQDIEQFRSVRECLKDNAHDRKDFTENNVNNNLLLMKFYALSSGMVNHLLSSCDGTEMDFPFQLTDQEMEVVRYNRSSFILGRSGTGKSTVLIAKLFQKEQLFHIASEGFHDPHTNTSVCFSSRNDVCEISEAPNVLRQIFVAVNPRLCHAVKEHISRLKGSTFYEGETSSVNDDDLEYTSQFSNIPDSFIDLPSPLYPLVIPFHKFLMMLDGTIGKSFFETSPEVKRFCRGQKLSSKSVALNTFIRTKEVNYDRFRLSYWPHLNTELTKNFESSAVFREIISRIKGQTTGSCLSREDYVSLSEGRLSILSEQERERVYGIFQQYEKMKRVNGEFDLPDFVIDLHERLGNEEYKGDRMDFVYIDEAQDLNMAEVALFRYVCRNVEEGFAFAGDTAQTIAKGVDFRFEDIRSLFYKEFLLQGVKTCKRGDVKGKFVDTFQLSRNFRTHRGILNMAQSVVDLLYSFFPNTIDLLSPETSHISGEIPVFLMVNEKHSFSKMFKGVEIFCGNMVGFGAEQVLLVRDVRAKDEMIRNVGKQALVLTILECKGLEFQDVLICNFFTSSPFKKWEVISEYMKEENLVDSSVKCPSFNVKKHAVLCSELKQLYVAITRTRQRLWFYEDGVEYLAAPVFEYWRKLGFIKCKLLDDTMFQQMQVPSSLADWKSRGITLFHQCNYDSARMCFKRAGDAYWEKLAEASSLRFAADCMRSSNPDIARLHLQKAAEIFDYINKPNSAAQCFFESQEYEKAAAIYLEKFPESKWEEAGECLTLAGCYKRAADVYSRGSLFSKCLSSCAKGQIFEMGLQYIRSWNFNDNLEIKRSHLDKVVGEFFERAASYYHKSKDFGLMMNFVRAFSTKNDMRNFLEKKNCLDELLLLEVEWGNFLKAANIARRNGDFDKEVSMLEKAGRFKEAALLVHQHVLCNSLWEPHSEGWPLKDFEKKNELLMKAQTLSKHVSDNFHKKICAEGIFFSDKEDDLFKLKRGLEDSSIVGSVTGEILFARKILDYHLQRIPSGYELKDVDDFVYYWNFWKQKIENVLEYLQDAYKEFCSIYLGVRTLVIDKEPTLFQLLNREAIWVREINNRSIKKKDNMVTVTQDQFLTAARSFWSSETLSIGEKVLNYIKALYGSTVENELSVHYQIAFLNYIFKVSRGLLRSKSLDRRYHQSRLQKFHEKSVDKLFSILYPLDCRRLLVKEMVFERDGWKSKTWTEDVIYDLIHFKISLTKNEIGKVLTGILGTGELSDKLYEQIFHKFDFHLPWTACVNEIITNRCSFFLKGSNHSEESDAGPSILSFHKVLKDIFDADWIKDRDYIPVDAFLYLVERFLLLIFYCNGCFYTTTSSFVEWMIHHKWTINSNFDPAAVSDDLSFSESLDFVVNVIEHLLYNDQDLMGWIEKSKMSLDCFPLVVLRLFIILSLIRINTGMYDGLLFDLLCRREISSILPWKFYHSLRENWKPQSLNRNLHVLSDALKEIGDPLVIVGLASEFPRFPGVAFVNLKTDKGRSRIMSLLCLKNDKASPIHQTRAGHLGISEKMDYGQFWSEINLLHNTKDVFSLRTMLHNATRIKEVILKVILMISYAMQQRHHKNLVGDNENLLEEINMILDDLQQLYSIFDSSCGGETESRIKQLAKSLIQRRPVMDLLLEQELAVVDEGISESGVSMEDLSDNHENLHARRSTVEGGISTDEPSNKQDNLASICVAAQGLDCETGITRDPENRIK